MVYRSGFYFPVVGTCLIWDDQWNPSATVGTMGSPKRWFVATQLGHWSCFDCWIIRIIRSSTARLHGGDSSDQGKAYHVTSKDCAGLGPIESTSQNFMYQYLVVTDTKRCCTLSLETFSNKSAWCRFGCDPKFGNYVGASPSSSILHHVGMFLSMFSYTMKPPCNIEP